MRKVLLGSALLAGLLLSGGFSAPGVHAAAPAVQQQAISENAALKFDELHKDFGRVDEGEKVTITYKVKNVTDKVIDIKDIHPTCGCTAANNNPDKVNPGEEVEIKLLFSSAGRLGEQYKTARIVTSDPNQEVYTISFAGNVTTDLEFNETILNFGDLEQGDASTKRVKLLSHAEQPVKVLAVKSEDPRIKVRLVPEEELKAEAEKAKAEKAEEGQPAAPEVEGAEKAKQEWVVEVKIPEDIPPMNLFSRIYAETDHPSKQQVGVSLRARILGEVVASPTQIVAVVEPEGKMDRFVTLTARKAKTITVNEVTSSGDIPVTFEVEDMQQPNMKRLKATFTGTGEPERVNDEAIVKITTDEGKTMEIPVPIIMVVRAPMRPAMTPGLPQRPTTGDAQDRISAPAVIKQNAADVKAAAPQAPEAPEAAPQAPEVPPNP
jgi:hypothetical protein